MKASKKNLGNEIAKGAAWTVASRLGIRFLGVISTIVLARILLPEDFGIVAKAAVIYGFLESVSVLGLHGALIKNQAAGKPEYDTAWTLNIFRALLIATLLLFVARPAAEFFREPGLDLIIHVFAIYALLTGFQNIGTVDFRRDFKFHLDFKFVLTHKLAGLIAALSVAFIWRTYWAFLAGIIASGSMSLLMSYVLSPYRPRIALSRFRALFGFSKWMLGHEIATAFSSKLDALILGRLSTTSALGIYSVSYELSSTPSTEMSMPVARAMMPGLSKANHNPLLFRDLFQSTLAMVFILVIPAGLGISATAGEITLALLGSRWSDATEIIEILAIGGIAAASYACSIVAFVAYDRVDLVAKMSAVRLAARLVFVPLGFFLGGVPGLAWAVVVAESTHMMIVMWVHRATGMLSMRDLVDRVWRVLLAGLIMYVAVKFLGSSQTVWMPSYVVVKLLIEICGGILVYAATLYTLWRLSGRPAGPELTAMLALKSRLPWLV